MLRFPVLGSSWVWGFGTLLIGSIALVCPAFFVAQVCIVPCPCCQPIHWPVHPCPNHWSTNVSAHKNIMFVVVFVFRCTYHHNGNDMLSNANMRKYRPCHAFPNIVRSRRDRTQCAEPGLKPPSRPAAALPCQNQETRLRSISS